MDVKTTAWTDFDRRRQETDLAILVSGAVEVYGPHLPLGSDTIVAEAVARQVAERTGGVVLPAVPVGYSAALAEFPGTLSVPPEAFKAYLQGLAESIVGWGFKRLLFINSHRGNVPMISQIADELQAAHAGVKCAQVFWWDYAAALAADLLTSGPVPYANGHAGEVGTSTLLYVAPELVHTDRIERAPDAPANRFRDIIQYESYRARSPNGVVGDPTHASREKGEQIVERGVARIVEFVQTAF